MFGDVDFSTPKKQPTVVVLDLKNKPQHRPGVKAAEIGHGAARAHYNLTDNFKNNVHLLKISVV